MKTNLCALIAAAALAGACASGTDTPVATTSASVGGGGGASGATLQASKTLDICDNGDGTWTYSGEVSVWNTGVNDANGLTILDCLQYKAAGQSGQPTNVICLSDVQGETTTIGGLTDETEATTFAYTFTGVFATQLDVTGTIRNSAQVNIVNHSGGQVTGPNPKATWSGGTPPACVQECGCELTQGYWQNHPEAWPIGGPQPGDLFFSSGATYAAILDASVAGGNAYMNLAHQYIAAVLNVGNRACEPDSVAQLIMASAGFFAGFPAGSSFCASSASGCPLQVTWAGLLADYNHATGGYSNLCSE